MNILILLPENLLMKLINKKLRFSIFIFVVIVVACAFGEINNQNVEDQAALQFLLQEQRTYLQPILQFGDYGLDRIDHFTPGGSSIAVELEASSYIWIDRLQVRYTPTTILGWKSVNPNIFKSLVRHKHSFKIDSLLRIGL